MCLGVGLGQWGARHSCGAAWPVGPGLAPPSEGLTHCHGVWSQGLLTAGLGASTLPPALHTVGHALPNVMKELSVLRASA